MKIRTLILFIIVLLATTNKSLAQQSKIDISLLVNREWSYDKASVSIATQDLFETAVENAKKTKDKKAHKELKNNESSFLEYFKEVLSQAKFSYKSDKTLSVFIDNQIQLYTWGFDKQTNKMTTIKEEDKSVVTIKELTKFKLILIDDKGMELTYASKQAKEMTFDTESLAKDFDIYRTIIETAHSGLYLYTPKTEFDSILDAAKTKIPALKNTREFYKLIASIHSKINCGHSSFYPSGDIYSELNNNSENAFFPFKIKFLNNTLVAAEDFKSIKKGSQIRSINNNSVETITKETFKLLSSDGYNTTFKYRQLEDDFSSLYFLAFGKSDIFSLKAIMHNSNKEESIHLDGINRSEIGRTITESHYEKPYYLEYIDDKTALLTVNTFSTNTPKNQKLFFKFLKKNFKEINEKGIENLILDIRENTGGDDGNDMELASYFINSHFKENKFRKLNALENMPPEPQYLHDEWFDMLGIDNKLSEVEIQQKFRKEASSFLNKNSDGTYFWKESEVLKRDPAKNRFKGNVYILTSGKVFSGGSLFSALVRDKSDAIFIGEETGGGYYRHTGTIPMFYKLPNSKFTFSLFTVINEQDVNKKLMPEGRGIIPHYKVYQTADQYDKGIDAVLEKAKELINK